MKPLTLKLLSVVLLSSVLFSCAKEDDGIYFNDTAEVINTENVSYSVIENEILTLINSYRQDKGLSTLVTLNVVSSVADGHTNYMIETGEVSHANFSERAQILMNNAAAKSVGENVAYGFNSAEGAVNGWLNSEEHRKIIESPDYTHFGISTDSDSEGRNYFTHIYIKK